MEFWRDRGPDAGCVPEGLLVRFGRGDAGIELRSGAIMVTACSESHAWGRVAMLWSGGR